MKIPVFLLLAFLALPATAQNIPASVQLTAGKIPAPVPDYCRWVISYQYQKTATTTGRAAAVKPATGDNRPAKVVVIKTGKIISQTIESVSGQRTESWIVNQAHLQRSSLNAGISAASVEENHPGFVPVQNGNFPEFAWVHASNFKGLQSWQGHQALLFQKEDKNRPNGGVACTAMIDSESLMPLMLQTGDELRLYECTWLPKTVQTLPPEVASYLDKLNDSFRRLLATPARPF